MIRRLLYHFFWNFYDYLGSYLLLGVVSVLAVTVLVVSGGAIASLLPVGALQIVAATLTFVLLLVLKAWFLAGFFSFATRAAKDEPARLPDFRQGTRTLFRPYLKLTLILGLLALVVASNIVFYLRLGAPAASVAAMLFLWVGVGVLLYSFSALAVPARFPDENRLPAILRRGVMLFALAPRLWIAVALLYISAAVLCFLSVVGAIFLLPVLATLATTALDLVVRLVEDLGKARAELGEGRPVRAYKRRALELGWEWEYRQPRRTLRELIKPWET